MSVGRVAPRYSTCRYSNRYTNSSWYDGRLMCRKVIRGSSEGADSAALRTLETTGTLLVY